MESRPQPVEVIDDLWPRLVGIPAFGLLIPHFVGLFGDLGPAAPAFWLGSLWFLGLAFVIWQGNRWLLFRQRSRFDWFQSPAVKIIGLVFACTFYTAPVTAAWIYGWYLWSGLPLDLDALRAVVLVNVICVLFVTHAYETVFLIKGRSEDSVQIANMKRAATQAQLDALRQQVDPHFLFNSLNTMASLVETDSKAALAFNRALADVYRYLLDPRALVPLKDELVFAGSYAFMLQLRFGESLRISLPEPELFEGAVPPTAVQTLLENAVKHTSFEPSNPLEIRVEVGADWVQVSNRLQPKADDPGGSGVGLANLDERCKILLGRGLEIQRSDERFVVRVPVGAVRA